MNKTRLMRNLLWAWKISIGCSMAIWLAEHLGLQHSTMAGSIALLTLVSTKWGTVKLAFDRILTFGIAITIALFSFGIIQDEWVAFGIYIFLIVLICELANWRSTISVNALIGIHFLLYQDYSIEFIINEFFLVLIGIILAFILNLFHDNTNHKNMLQKGMRYGEEQMQVILEETAGYLMFEKMERNVWKDIDNLMAKMSEFKHEALEYQDNTFSFHPDYYIQYFEMRKEQCIILKNLHDNLKKLRTLPKQARLIAEYMLYLKDYVVERNIPEQQMEMLQLIFEGMRHEELPVTREEFEDRALLYHVLMDLEDFLMAKTRFVNGIDEVQKKKYWNQ